MSLDYLNPTDASGNRQTIQTGGVPVIANPQSDTWVKTETSLQRVIRECEEAILDYARRHVPK